MIGIELVKDRINKTPVPEEAAKLREICRKNGLLIGVGGVYENVLRLQPPLVITENRLDKALEILDRAFYLLSKGE